MTESLTEIYKHNAKIASYCSYIIRCLTLTQAHRYAMLVFSCVSHSLCVKVDRLLSNCNIILVLFIYFDQNVDQNMTTVSGNTNFTNIMENTMY